eukprot:GHVR01127232.1.p1 GENE.GHVR01127232.1~~GHVR01127232.1.p1  ORF type:complete len:311 (-),score=17.06 GHVR01127232.1:122-1054(-)
MPNNPKMDTARVDDPFKDYKIVPIHESPLVINWKGKIGYGDIISPICYAFNCAEKNATDVVLNFHWEMEEKTLYKPEDTEYIQDWCTFIADNTKPVNFFDVKINHVYGSKLQFNHDNYVDGNGKFMPIHNLRPSIFGWSDKPQSVDGTFNKLCLVTSLGHKQQLRQYAEHKAWKDPLGETPGGHAWDKVANSFNRRGYETKHVHYSTPIERAVKMMNQCSGVVGYHGAHMWLAKWLGLPMIIFSKGGKLHGNITRKAFPWAVIYEYWTDYSPEHTMDLLHESIRLRDETYEEYKYYLTGPNLHRLRGERT